MRNKLIIRSVLLVMIGCSSCSTVKNAMDTSTDRLRSWMDSGKTKLGLSVPDTVVTPIRNGSFEKNMGVPLSGNVARQVDNLMANEARRIQRFKHVSVDRLREGEVIRATIPMAQLFEPNDTLLSNKADNILRPFIRYMSFPGYYKLLLVTHTDNTGSEEYTQQLSEERAVELYDWFCKNGADSTYIAAYAKGSKQPVTRNDSEEDRALNRRLEIYLVPGDVLLKDARKGKISH